MGGSSGEEGQRCLEAAQNTRHSPWLVGLHSPANGSQDVQPVSAISGRHVELYTFSLVGAPVWLGWRGTETGGELREGPLSSLFHDSGRPVVRSGLRGGGSHSFPWLCPRWARLREERRKGMSPSGFGQAEPSKEGSSMQMTPRPEPSGPEPPSQRSSWRR